MGKSVAEDMVTIFSRMPWWICLTLAAISYFVLNYFSIKFGQPFDTTGFQVGTMGEFVTKQMWKTMAWFGKFFFPFIFGIAAIASFIKSIDKTNNEKKWMIAIFGFIFLTISIIALFKHDQQQKITKNEQVEKQKIEKTSFSKKSPIFNIKEEKKTENKSIEKQVIYSWTNKEGKRVYSNFGFPKDEKYSNPQINYY